MSREPLGCSGFPDSRAAPQKDAGQDHKSSPVFIPVNIRALDRCPDTVDAKGNPARAEIRGRRVPADPGRPGPNVAVPPQPAQSTSLSVRVVRESRSDGPAISRDPRDIISIQLPESGDDWYDRRSPARRVAVVGIVRNVIMAGASVCSPPGVGVRAAWGPLTPPGP